MKTLLGSGLIAAGLLLFATAAQAGCATDLDGNGVTDEADVAILQSAMGTGEGDDGYLAEADFNGDGTVSMADYAVMLACN